eukprot:5083508-Heterocapsa_arctica.AAC.1
MCRRQADLALMRPAERARRVGRQDAAGTLAVGPAEADLDLGLVDGVQPVLALAAALDLAAALGPLRGLL